MGTLEKATIIDRFGARPPVGLSANKHHLLRLLVFCSGQLVKIYAARDLLSGVVSAVPCFLIPARDQMFVNKHSDQVSGDIVDLQARRSRLCDIEADRCGGVERVGEAVVQPARSWCLVSILDVGRGAASVP